MPRLRLSAEEQARRTEFRLAVASPECVVLHADLFAVFRPLNNLEYRYAVRLDVDDWLFQNTNGYTLVVEQRGSMSRVAIRLKDTRDAAKFALAWL